MNRKQELKKEIHKYKSRVGNVTTDMALKALAEAELKGIEETEQRISKIIDEFNIEDIEKWKEQLKSRIRGDES